MAIEQNRAASHRFVEGVLNRGDLAVIDEIFDPGFIDHAQEQDGDREAVKFGVAAIRRAFPDLHFDVQDEIVTDDKVVGRLTATGTMRGDLLGMPATGKTATWEEIHITRLVGGRFVEHWSLSDQLAMLRQLGLMPEAEGAPVAQ